MDGHGDGGGQHDSQRYSRRRGCHETSLQCLRLDTFALQQLISFFFVSAPSAKAAQSFVAMPGLTIGDTVPNLELDSTHGKIRIHDFVGDTYVILFSHPGDFTPVCTTELAAMAGYAKEFDKRGVKLLGISCDDVQSHKDWIKDIEAYKPGNRLTYPIMADPSREAIKQLNMVDPDEKDSNGGHLPSRALHIVGPDKKVKLSFLYPACVGRNMDEVVRAVDALQTAAKHAVATPVNWKPGERVVIPPGVSDDEAKEKFPQGFDTADLPSGKGYLRFTKVG
uniref:thioredoxin-dependent peroxiredoxin n=1 Tax=Oryza rufipogon TaxID=4529 RepID=A0A0E0QBT2_ORYRU